MIYTSSLNQNTDFKRIYYRGLCRTGRDIVIYGIKARSNKETRLGITVSKKVGNAVVRNRVRRIITAAYRRIEKENDLKGYNFVVVGRKSAAERKSTDIYFQMKRQFPALLEMILEKQKNNRQKRR